MTKTLYALGALCLALAAADLVFDRHDDIAVANLPLLWCAFGFVAYVVIIFAAKALRLIALRPEDYYGREAVDAEENEARDV